MVKRFPILLLFSSLCFFACTEGPVGKITPPVVDPSGGDGPSHGNEPAGVDDSLTFKILFWNIQKGMFADQANDYEHFTKWIESQDPDVCVFNEGGTQYYDDRLEDMPVEKRPLPSGWPALAKRYGHDTALWVSKRAESSAVQVLTSKHPARLVARVENVNATDPLAMTTGLFEVETPFGSVYFVASHLYSTTGAEYDPIRLGEMKAILKQTKNSQAYSSQKNWVMMGDMNTQSPADEWYYKYGKDTSAYITVNHLLTNTDYIDSWLAKHPGQFQYTASGSMTRKDFVFLSPALYGMCASSEIILDGFTTPVKNSPIKKMYYPSDHLPIIVCLKYPNHEVSL